MILSIKKSKFWSYLKSNILYRVRKVRLRKGVKILIAIVLGALLLAGLYTLFDDTIMPTLTERIEEMFDYAG
ncbi:MAG: DUF6133 family protein [Clostridia bacterium]